MLSVYLLRHGETQYNADGNRYCGRTDIPLTDKGIAQAQAVRLQLQGRKLDAVYSSPLKRANETAKIASGNNLVIADQRLIEIDFGTWEGKRREEFVAENPTLWNNWSEDPAHAAAGGTGENATQVVERVGSFFAEMQQKYKEGTILVVGHNGINRLFMAHKLGMPLKNYRRIVQHNSSLTFFQLDENGEFTLEKLNTTS
ncbi:MAG: histidine phosphatase family protein [Pedobacter sp.]|uniref:histidine phosphatase family protein n=1 Tax=Pedobacter sp. TaxID=1411316 RepID=UPI0028088D2F|nr:histidine phosphatase family protein [Pedobacter sp.]MDQ8005546.1 histidine phosphatase family protein [Pedobacter sp.]